MPGYESGTRILVPGYESGTRILVTGYLLRSRVRSRNPSAVSHAPRRVCKVPTGVTSQVRQGCVKKVCQGCAKVC